MSDIILHNNSFGGNDGIIPVRNYEFLCGMKLALSAKTLYDFLGLAATQWKRWSKKNILDNPYAIENEDYRIFDLESRNIPGRPTDDYIISLDLAKKLSMMTRTPKGEEARNYFLECERIAQGQQLPHVTNPALQAIIDIVIRQDQLEQQVLSLQERDRQRDRLLIAQQEEIIRSLQQSQRAEEKASMALDDAHLMTVEEFVVGQKLVHQFPPNTWSQAGKWLKKFCGEWGLKSMPKPTPWNQWKSEQAYPTQALSAWLKYQIRNGGQVSIDGIEEDGVWYRNE